MPLFYFTGDETQKGWECSVKGNLSSMFSEYSRKSGILAAAVLACVTLFAFYVLQYYGPESVVRQVHRAVAREGAESAKPFFFLNQNYNPMYVTAAVQEELKMIQSAAGTAVDIRMPMAPKTVDGERRAKVAVTYFARDGRQVTLPWVVVKVQRQWLVDAAATFQLWRGGPMTNASF